MLWRAEKTRDDVVRNSGQGIYWQGSDITHRPDETNRMGGLGIWRHAEGVPHACTARRTLLLEKITWGQVNPAREQMSPPWRGSSTGLKGCCRQQFPARKHLLNPFRCMIIANLNHNNWGLEALMTRREKEFRSTGTCKLLRDKRVGGRGYNWSEVQTCRSQRRDKLITRMTCYA